MKTQKNSCKNIIRMMICSVMTISFSLTNESIHAQSGPYTDRFSALISGMIEKDSLFTEPVYDAVSENNAVGSEKLTGSKIMQFFLSLAGQSQLSRESRKNGPYDVIIVPGIPYNDKKITGLILQQRVLWAYYLVSGGIAENVIFSGGAVYSPYVESRIMALYAAEMGIPSDHIFCETKAEHSTENLVYSLRLADSLGFDKVAVATGPYQSALLSVYAKDHSMDVSFIPFRITPLQLLDSERLPAIDPSSASVSEFVSITERLSRSERFQGTLGNRIGE